MDPDVLGKVRHVYPRQSEPCKVSGYVLTFAHRGLPYQEPGFGTIEPLKWDPVPPTLTISFHAQQNSAAQPGKATMYSTPSTSVAGQLASKRHAQAVADQDPESPRPGSPINGIYGSPELPVSFGSARSAAKRSRTSPVSDSSCDYESSDFNLDGSHAQGSNASSGMGLHNGHHHVEVHGVVHQISQMDMAQICKTESGGGGGNHGYYLESLSCQLYNGQAVQALALLTFPASLHRQKEPALPSERYLKILQRGAKHSQLASEYQVYLQALQHYHASKPGQRIGRSLMTNVFGRPLRLLVLRVLPNVHNKFLVWTIHHIFERLLLLMWLLHDYLLEPILGSGRHL